MYIWYTTSPGRGIRPSTVSPNIFLFVSRHFSWRSKITPASPIHFPPIREWHVEQERVLEKYHPLWTLHTFRSALHDLMSCLFGSKRGLKQEMRWGVVGSIERRMFMHIYIMLIYIYMYRCIEFCVNTCVRKYVHAFLDFLLYLYMHGNVSTCVKCVAFTWFMPSLLLIATKIHSSKECDLVDGKLQTTWRLPLGWMAPTAVPLL